MEQLEVGMSPHQMSRVRNGHSVRVKPAMKGSGVVLMVSPSTFNIANRSLSKQKGVQIKLSPEEIQANREMGGEMEGRGIFKRGLKKVGKVIGREFAKKLPALATAGLTGLATVTGQPQLIPLAGVVGNKLGKVAEKKLTKAIGKGAGAPVSIRPVKRMPRMPKDGAGLYAGKQGRGMCSGMEGEGLYAGKQGRGVATIVPNTPTAGLVGVRGSLLNTSHPAFQSQAQSANFQFRHTMPPQFQMKGNGLYA